MKYVEYLGWLVVALKPISFFSDLENWKLRKLPATLNWQVGNFTVHFKLVYSQVPIQNDLNRYCKSKIIVVVYNDY